MERSFLVYRLWEGTEPKKLQGLCTELSRQNLSLCAISEHRWKDTVRFNSVNSERTFVYSGVPRTDMARKGVGFLLNRPLLRAWQDAGEFCGFGGARLLRTRRLLRGRFITLISCYAPTFQCSAAEKETFYSSLAATLDSAPARDGCAGSDHEPEAPVRTARPFLATRTRERLRIMSTCLEHQHYGTSRFTTSPNGGFNLIMSLRRRVRLVW